MKALVTGGAGFIGSHLAELLLNQGHKVVVLDNLNSGQLRNIEHLTKSPNFEFKKIDIRNVEAIESAIQEIDWVFHLAGLADIVPSIESPREYYDVNVNGTFNVLEACRKDRVKRVLYAASSSSYGFATEFPTPEIAKIAPEYPYALTKYMGEELVIHWAKVYGLPTVSLRLFNVYGPRSRTSGTYGAVFGVFLAQKIARAPFTVVGDGTQTRDFTYVTDVANAFYCAAKSNVSGEVMNIGSSNHYSVNRLVELLGGEKTYIPKRPGEPDCTFADISKVKRLVGWTPHVSFEDGVAKMLENIDYWRDAPLWDPTSIGKATNSWFKYLDKKTD
jgi:UDP-glucose 4-epimerase